MQFVSLYIKLAATVRETFYRPVAREISGKFFKKRESFKLLDVGAGPGDLSFELISLNPWMSVYTIDKSEKFTKIARTRAHFSIVGDAGVLPYKNESFDFIVSTGVLHVLENPASAITEWIRVLKTAGELCIYDPTVLISEQEFFSPALLKKRLSFKDYLLLRFLIRFSSQMPPRIMSIEKIFAILNGVDNKNNLSLLKIDKREGYFKIEIAK
jgi:ubiquinone/menaquinone biosynthesis C-methylase UbiE